MRLLASMTLAAILLAVAPGAAAQDADEDAAWRDEARVLTFNLVSNGFDLRSVRDSELGQDTLTARFAQDTATLHYQFASTEPQNRSLIDITVSVLAVIEYRDLNADGRLGLDDQIVQRIALSQLEARPMQSTAVDGGGHLATAFYPWPIEEDNDSLPVGGQPPLVDDGVELHFRVTPVERNVQGVLVTPTEVKMDIEFTAFPYERPDSLVAVQTRVSTTNDDIEPVLEERRLYVPDGYFRGYYAWDASSRVDGVVVPVQPSLMAADDGVHTVALTYGRGEHILHDPTVGVIRLEGEIIDALGALVKGDLVLYLLGGLATAAAVAVPSTRRLLGR